MLGEHATPEAVARLRELPGAGQAAARPLRAVRRAGVARGDLGRSIQQNRPVVDELADAWPATLELTVAALLLAAVVGVAAGVVSAVWPNSLFDAVARLGSLFGLSMPVFWTGLVLIVVFALLAAAGCRWAAAGGRSPSRAARGDAGAALGGDGRAHDALERARRAARGLRAHRAGQGRGRAARGRQARPAQRGDPHPDRWSGCRPASYGRRGADRDGVRVAGAGPAHGQGDLRARLRRCCRARCWCSPWPSC